MAKNTASPAVEDNWQARSDLNTLTEAEKIRKDPKRLAAAKAEGKRQLEAVKTALEAK